jgi:ribosomal protein S18 acetylase RimI-like enzyme
MEVSIQQCNLNDPKHTEAFIFLLNHYMMGTMGGFMEPHSPESAIKVINGLRDHPSKLILLASSDNEYAGMTVSFINFSTFAAKPFINIHDVIVLEKFRGCGIGRKLIEENLSVAQEMNCSKITLEVREDNFSAQKLYKSCGFEESRPPMYFWSKYL